MLPRVISETRRKVMVRPPPPKERISPHYWLDERGKWLYMKQLKEVGLFPLYISKIAEEKIRNHAITYAASRKEVLGFLLGDLFSYRGLRYTVAVDVVTTDLDSDSIYVRFDRNGLGKLSEKLDEVKFDYLLLGWYHSHPGHSCFMSKRDEETQRSLFQEEYHSAIVIDPINFMIEAFSLRDGKIVSLPFAVYWEEYQDPYRKVKKLRKWL